MSKNKKRKKTNQQPQMGGYKKFLLDMQEALRLIFDKFDVNNIPNEYKRMMYEKRILISNPEATNSLISPKELKHIADRTKRYYREKNIGIGSKKHSAHQLMLQYCFAEVRAKMLEKEIGDKNAPEVIDIKKTADGFFQAHYFYFILNHFRMITRLNNPCSKYYGIKIDVGPVKSRTGFVIEAYGIPAIKFMMHIDGIKRPTFRLGRATKEAFEWITVPKNALGDYYKGDKEVLDVYIQSHAMERLSQRLDLLDKEAINYLIWENTHTIKQFEFYKGYILLPVMLYNVKVGYLMAKVVEDKVLFRTFLFITHNFSPEGDKLKEISGLGKHDISYWHIDRLSTFVNLDGNKYKGLLGLFQQAGIEDFQQLKEKDFHIDQLQSVNLDGLMDYIKKGQQAEKVQKKEFSEFVAEG